MDTYQKMERYSEKRLSRLSPQESIHAVENGTKPLALFTKRAETDLPCLEFDIPMISTDGKSTITGIFKAKNYIYYKAGQELNAKNVKDLVTQMNDQKIANLKVGDKYINNTPSDAYHRELGKLLGYGDDEINEFIGKLHS